MEEITQLIDRKPKNIIIADAIRRQITSNVFPVGERLLSDDDFALKYSVNKRTVAAGLNILVKEGLLERIHRRGTFVSKHALKHLEHKNIGILMPALGTELTLRQSPINYLIFDGIQKFCHEKLWDIQMMQSKILSLSLNRLAQSNIAGLIVIMPKKENYKLLADFKALDIPFVCINFLNEEINRDINFVNIDFYNAIVDAVKHLYKNGQKNIAFICPHKLSSDSHIFYILKGYKYVVKLLGLKENIRYIDEIATAVDFNRQKNQLLKNYDAFVSAMSDSKFPFVNDGGKNIKIKHGTSLISFFENQATKKTEIRSYTPDLTAMGYESIRVLDKIFDNKYKKLQQQQVALQSMELVLDNRCV